MTDEPKTGGKPGEISQWPRWEGPAENRPSGYIQGEANIFADDPVEEKKQTATDYPAEDLEREDREKQEAERDG
jgi:hyperosmotically inducible periplasmic protein